MNMLIVAMLLLNAAPSDHSAAFNALIEQAQHADPWSQPKNVPKDREKAIDLYRQALALDERSKDDLPHVMRLGSLLLDQPETYEEGLVIYKDILNSFNYMDYYLTYPSYSGDELQYRMIAVAIYAGEYFKGMKLLHQTYQRRREDWLNAPKPIRPPDVFGGLDPEGKWKMAVADWQWRKDAAASGKVFVDGQPEMLSVQALVRHYGNAHGAAYPADAATTLQPIIDAFPDSPFEKEAQRIIDGKVLVRKRGVSSTAP